MIAVWKDKATVNAFFLTLEWKNEPAFTRQNGRRRGFVRSGNSRIVSKGPCSCATETDARLRGVRRGRFRGDVIVEIDSRAKNEAAVKPAPAVVEA